MLIKNNRNYQGDFKNSPFQIVLQPRDGDPELWEIILEGEKWREVHRTIFGKHPTVPFVHSLDQWPAVFDAWEYQRAKKYVLWRLSKQSYHSEQLAKLLRERLVQNKTITSVMEECHQAGYLDDAGWLRNFVSHHQKRCGVRLMFSKLKFKGLSEESLSNFFDQWTNPEAELSAIQHLLQTRYRSKNLSLPKERQKVIAGLMRKGYIYEQIKRAMETA